MQTIIRSLTVLHSSLFLADVWIRFIWLKPCSHSAEDIGNTARRSINILKSLPTMIMLTAELALNI